MELDNKLKSDLLIVLGALKLGDTFFCFPAIRGLLKKYNCDSFDWLHGTFAGMPIVEMLPYTDLPLARNYHLYDLTGSTQHLDYEISAELKNGTPFIDVVDVVLAKENRRWTESAKEYLEKYNLYEQYKHIEILDQSKITNQFDTIEHMHMRYRYGQGFGLTPEEVGEPTLKTSFGIKDSGYIAVQPSTYLKGKVIPDVYRVKYPLPVACLGDVNDEVILADNVTDYRNCSLSTTLKIIASCSLFVGCASCLPILSQYLGKKTIMCHYDDNPELVRAISVRDPLHPYNINLINPSKEEIESAMDIMITDIKNGMELNG